MAGMIEPFVEHLERTGVISYGVSSFGYDVRAAPEWRVFVNAFNTIVDPKAFDPASFVEFDDETCIIPPNSFVLTRSVEYLRIPDDVMVVALGKSSYARCFSGDTRVALVDGREPTLEEMADAAGDRDPFFGYSIGPTGRLVVSLLDRPRFIGRDELVEVALDDGATIRCTPDHEFMARDGSLRPAAALQPGQSLMPLYRTPARGYEMVYLPMTGYLYPTHRLADEWNVRNGIYEDAPGTHRHHIDFDRSNNNPWNLVRMDAGERIRLHDNETCGDEFDAQAHGAAIRVAFERLRNDPDWLAEWRASRRRRALSFWHDPAYRARREQLIATHQARWTQAERDAQRDRRARFWDGNDDARAARGRRSRRAWQAASPRRRRLQQDIARRLRLRGEITEPVVREALEATGSIRGAARSLECDRSVLRRFPDTLARFRGRPEPTSEERRNHRVAAVRPIRGEHDVYCLTVPEAGNFALAAGVFVSNCGIVANVTPLEPGWEGHVTLELSNTTPLPAKVYANEGIVQLLFFQGDERPETTYADRKGKYQGQRGVTLPKV